jgi:hypothetical protein
MNKSVAIVALVLLGVYFVLFHTEPYPLNHEAIGLPPLHTIHTIFGMALLAAAYVWKKK